MRNQIRSHPLETYFALTFLLSWSLWIPMALDRYSLLSVQLNPNFVQIGRLLGTLGPALAAILVTVIAGGKPAVAGLFRPLGRWRVGWKWFLLAGLLFPLLLFVTAGLYQLVPAADPLPFQPLSIGSLVAVIIILTISVLGEEIGWRGFALPKLLERWPALHASLILGAIHTFWHLPFWIVLGELESFGPGYWLISWVFVSALSIYITWLLIHTRSLLMPVLFHWSLNIVSVGFLPITTLVPAYIIFTTIAWAVAILLVRRYGPALAISQAPMPEPSVAPAG